MPATVTLSETTLAAPADRSVNEVKLASTTNVTVDSHLFVGGELMRVQRLLVDGWVKVSRGVGGTNGVAHPSSDTVYIGRGDQFYLKDPVGIPADAIAVSPYINVKNGNVWFARGDSQPNGNAVRWWQLQAPSHSVGATGQQQTTYDPTVST